jgi:hypothetical protein
MKTTLAEIERERGILNDERTKRVSDHAAWLKACDVRLKELSERTALLSIGVDVGRMDRALKVLWVEGDPTKVVQGNGFSPYAAKARSDALAYAKRLLAESPATLQGRYIGVKNYSGFGDQREDHQYGMGPRHGDIVFRIGLTHEAREQGLTPEEVEDALYFLHVWPTVVVAKKAAVGQRTRAYGDNNVTEE